MYDYGVRGGYYGRRAAVYDHMPTQTTDAVTMAPQDTEVSNNDNPPTKQSLTEIPRFTPTKSILYARHTAPYCYQTVTSNKLGIPIVIAHD